MRTGLLILLMITIWSNVNAQEFFLANNQFSTPFFNPKISRFNIDFYYQNKYFIKEWNNKGTAITYQNNKSVLHLQFYRKGNNKFSDNIFKFIYHYNLSPKFKLSIGSKTQTIQQQEYKTVINPILPFLNLSVIPNKNYEINISGQTSVNSRIPDEVHTLLRRKLNNKLKLLIGFEFSTKQQLNFESGIVYQIKKKLDVELNINTSNTPILFAVRYKLKHQSIIISSEFHEKIGQSLGVQIQFTI